MSKPGTKSTASAWSPLQHRVFRWLWFASIASNIGTWMHEVGVGWMITSLTASPLTVSLVQVAAAAPMFFLALPAGAIADIADKRRYLLVVQTGMAAVALALAVLTYGGWITIPLLLIMTFAMGIGTALTMPAWSSLTPELVPGTDLPAAISLSSMGTNVARALGPALAGILIGAIGPWATFAINALSFFGILAVLFFWKRTRQPSVLPAERLLGAVRIGWQFARHSRHLKFVLVRTAAFFIGASACMSLLPLLVRIDLHGNAQQYGVLLGAVGVGAVIGAIFLPKLREMLPVNRLVPVASLVYASVLGLLGWVASFYVLVPVMFVSGTAWIAVLSSLQISAQTSVPSWVRARALSVYILVFFGCMAIGGMFWGWIADVTSIAESLYFAAIVMVVGILACAKIDLPTVDSQDQAPSLHWPQPVLSDNTEPHKGPVMVLIEYEVAPGDREGFTFAMDEVREMRRRNGSVSWQLMQDTGNPQKWLEVFFDESWNEHLRHHNRVTRAELKIEAAARRYQTKGKAVEIRHFLAG